MPRSGRGARRREDEVFLPEAPPGGSEQGREGFGPRAEAAAELTVHFTARGEIGEFCRRLSVRPSAGRREAALLPAGGALLGRGWSFHDRRAAINPFGAPTPGVDFSGEGDPHWDPTTLVAKVPLSAPAFIPQNLQQVMPSLLRAAARLASREHDYKSHSVPSKSRPAPPRTDGNRICSLFTLQLRAADRQVLLLDPAAGSTAVKPALAPGHQPGWPRCAAAAPSPAQSSPTEPTSQALPRTSIIHTRKCAARCFREQILGPPFSPLGQ
ncbi:uncharacterized protein LOC134428328 [Melospiza melodia melodia]|uniref:uncharacterized protein LOC134428328 n=1 Tax=Melospiza melodia melodia TaxID=1914991 RepID=UPI002FD1F4D7